MNKRKITRKRPRVVDASPVKSFFVEMLIRDIKLEEAILDLLDNCVDGILRTRTPGKRKKPYKGFWANIEFNKNTFRISDNCGGIPWEERDRAFRLGPPDNRQPPPEGAIGAYGIGMKRAIFKMGRSCRVSTRNAGRSYGVIITTKWIEDEKDWDLPITDTAGVLETDGTIIEIGNLRPGIAGLFDPTAKDFRRTLKDMVATHYAFIIDKGFEVTINGDSVSPRPTRLFFAGGSGKKRRHSIEPYIFKAMIEGVEVFLAVGFADRPPSENELNEGQEETRQSSEDAGWTVICNERAVLYCDTTELTGWGEAGVPRYHTQFINISGIVEFKSDDPKKLPTTTTKRGIHGQSTLYLKVKNRMRYGMKLFIDYTNEWKGLAEDSDKHFDNVKQFSFYEIKEKAAKLGLRPVKATIPAGEQYNPKLPSPRRPSPKERRISYKKSVKDVSLVAEHLFGDGSVSPSTVGERCFDIILREALKEK